MIKYLSVPDFHFHPDWLDVSLMCAKKIEDTARERNVDFILFPGDFFDKAIYATDKGGINEARGIIRRLNKICPVAAIYGTPSHDYKGCYGPLESEGLVVIQPGIPYRFYNRNIYQWEQGSDFADALLFGIPEPTKEVYQAKHPEVAADKVNAAIVNAINRIIVEQIAPFRLMFPDTPMIGMFHGNVSDAQDRAAETNVILKVSDIVIKTDSFAQANLNRWEFGHIHTPWESSKISGGYAGFAGMDRNPWNKTGFYPSMNYVELDATHLPTVQRIPYGTPKRIIIDKPLSSYEKNIAYWLKSDDHEAVCPPGHPWSRITYNETKTVSRRVDESTLEKAKTLPELAKLFDPNVSKKTLDVFALIEQQMPPVALAERSVELQSIEITGAKFWQGKTVSLDISKLPDGLTQIIGQNGSGKSAFLGFCSPYPCFIGKDTESGRMSAIKDFFQEPESGIKKTILYNGQMHEHIIMIRGAHTKTPKTECFLTIDGKPELERASFDDMFAACERFYGSLADYLMTSFYVQPLQGKAESGLMTANMATVRNLVQSIAGRDHAEEKAFALSKVREYEDLTGRESLLIESDERHIPDMDEILARKSQIEQDVEDTKTVQRDSEKNLESVQSHYDAMKLAHDAAEERLQRKNDLLKKAANVESEIENLKIKSDGLSFVIAGAQPARESLEKDGEVKKDFESARTEFMAMESRNSEKKFACEKASSQIREIDARIQKIRDDAESAYRLEYSHWEKTVAEAKEKISELTHQNDVKNQSALMEWQLAVAKRESDESKNAALNREIELIRKPCPNCGYLAPDIIEKIKTLESSLVNIPVHPIRPDSFELVIPIELLDKFHKKAPIQESVSIPQGLIDQRAALELKTVYLPESMTMPSRGLSDSDIATLKNDIDEATRAEAEQKIILSEIIPSKMRDVESLREESREIIVYSIDMSEENEKLASAKLAWSSAGEKISSLNTEFEAVKKDIQSIIDQREALEARKRKLTESNEWLEAWRQADTMLSPAKIPAMELEAALDAIDGEATRMIQPYRNGRYIFETVTQKLGTKDTVDKFDIIIHDCETGTSKSFLNFSVGEKSFFNDAYVKSLVKIRKSRMRVSYSPIIMDEADSFIDIPMIPQFDEIQREYYNDSDSKVLIVSHSPEAGNFLQSVKSMDEIKGGYYGIQER